MSTSNGSGQSLPSVPTSANATTIKPTDLRGILKYVPRFQGQIFVIAIDGSIVADDNFGSILRHLARPPRPVQFHTRRVARADVPSADGFTVWLDEQWLQVDAAGHQLLHITTP